MNLNIKCHEYELTILVRTGKAALEKGGLWVQIRKGIKTINICYVHAPTP